MKCEACCQEVNSEELKNYSLPGVCCICRNLWNQYKAEESLYGMEEAAKRFKERNDEYMKDPIKYRM